MEKLKVFIERLKKLGITITMFSNYPWIYIDTINGNKIKREDYFHGNHGFTIAFHPTKPKQVLEFTDITRIFELIRKYR
jgi:hypothetical protein